MVAYDPPYRTQERRSSELAVKIEAAPSGAGQFRCQILLIQGRTKLVWTRDEEPRGPAEILVCVSLSAFALTQNNKQTKQNKQKWNEIPCVFVPEAHR